MRVTFVSPGVGLSGGVRVMAIYADFLRKMGHDVCIVSQPPRPVPALRKLKSWLKGSGWPDAGRRPRSHLDGSEIEHRILDQWRPIVDADVPDGDVVIATWWETAEWVNALSPSKGAKVYFIQHHEVFPYLPVERSRRTYRLPLHKIVVSRWLSDVMRDQYGDEAVDLVPNSIDRTQFYAPARGKQPVPTIGFLYSSAPFKGLDVTLAAVRLVRELHPDLRIVAFGSEPPAASSPLPDGAEFLLAPPQEQIRDLYARCDVWMTASHSEGFNLPAMEAMACRTPVVSTRTGWPEEAVNSYQNGVLVDVDDAKALAEAIEWVLSRSDQEWRELSENAYATTRYGSWEASATMFERALERARNKRAQAELRTSYATAPV